MLKLLKGIAYITLRWTPISAHCQAASLPACSMGVSHPGRSCPLRSLQRSAYLPAGAMAPGGRCAASPICPSIRPQKLPMHALSRQQARLDMDCRIPGSLGLSRQARAAWWAPRSEHAQMSSGRTSSLSWSYVSSTSLSSIEMEHLRASSTSVWQSGIPDMQTKPSSMHGRQAMSVETALRGAPRLKSLSTALGATLGSRPGRSGRRASCASSPTRCRTSS